MKADKRKGAGIVAAAVGAALAWAPGVWAEGVRVDFDRGIGAKAVLEGLNDGGGVVPPAIGAEMAQEERATLGCEVFSFIAGDPSASRTKPLESQVFQTVCQVVWERKVCEDRYVRTERRQVTVKLAGARATLPWEVDAFQACLQNQVLKIKPLQAAHDYGRFVYQLGPENHAVTIPIQGKRRTPPDSSGITLAEFRRHETNPDLMLILKDKWAEHYKKGEKTILEIELKREAPHWLDSRVLKLDLVQKPAESYEVSFALLARLEGKSLVAGQKYYARWRFKREGKVSDASWQAGGETARVELPAK